MDFNWNYCRLGWNCCIGYCEAAGTVVVGRSYCGRATTRAGGDPALPAFGHNKGMVLIKGVTNIGVSLVSEKCQFRQQQ